MDRRPGDPMTSPFMELLALSRGERTRGERLSELVHRIAKRDRIAPDPEERAQQQLLDLLTRPEWYVDQLASVSPEISDLLAGRITPAAVDLADLKLRAYLGKANFRTALTAKRDEANRARLLRDRLNRDVEDGTKIKHETLGDEPNTTNVEIGAPAPDPLAVDADQAIEIGLELLSRALVRHCKGRKANDDARDRETYEAMVLLALGTLTMDRLIEREVAANPSQAPRNTVRDRLTRRHGRLREDLETHIDALTAEGEIRFEYAVYAIHTLDFVLNRRPNGDTTRVSTGEE